MARGQGSNATTPKAPPSSSAASTGKKQQSIAGFFHKRTAPAKPQASSDIDAASSPAMNVSVLQGNLNKENVAVFSSPSREAKRKINYAESGGDEDEDEDEDEVFKPLSGNMRSAKRRRISVKDASEDEEENDNSFATGTKETVLEEDEDVDTGVSTAQQWNYDPEAAPSTRPNRKSKSTGMGKSKACDTDPTLRHTWLAHPLDADRNAPDHPDYDPRTLYIPPGTKLSDFEKQYWDIKSKFMDTIVFFKKGKFYELYENDATIGHQLFDLKLTDRVNMRMVGVPEASLDLWANQFVAKGYKIARVDQMESKLSKDMRERDGGGGKEVKKIINRELASVLTSGTLVDGGMLQDDMATYCAAIKETEHDGKPAFGIAFVDTATAQFQLSEFVDDVDMTRFETFVAQTRPGELLLEKGCLSAKALRIIKNNTPATTIFNYLKPEKEFLTADKTRMKIDGERYFDKSEADGSGSWPVVLLEAKEKELAFPALGALVWYLSLLKIERDLITCGNFAWYDPIRKASSLVLDGQSLINLEIFANTFDGSTEGTLFTMLNRCITPFGKRMLRQWVCHPLGSATKINQRFDAIDALNRDGSVMESFTSSLSRLPDLERLISRVHAGRCKPQDFVKVLDGFEQIDYTMSLLKSFNTGNGLLSQLIAAMPDMKEALDHWKDAFDHRKAKDEGLFIPQPGVEEDFDESQDRIDQVLKELDALLNRTRKSLGSNAIKFTDNGKEIYQLEVPIKAKSSIPKNWKQMSATKQCKRWYSPELEELVQNLKEAQEMHNQVLKALAGRFFARFDIDYTMWLAAVKIVAQLDCLISLARASRAIGSPSCRPEFVEDDTARGVLEFKTLRHPCIETTTNFIPNDIALGGDAPSINLLTGANAAGKSTVLRMTCIAVIMAQVGCYVPCESARMTPVDRIMSRLGAHDNIFAGQSTFMVELSETKKILSEATPRSLVILDELGRGTSSYDGVAVAQAVLHHVASHIGSLGYFATHYHSLAAEFQHHPEIAAKRMAVQVQPDIRDVTFLYQLEDGVAEGSYGMHCASMCGISEKIIDRAEQAAQSWEHTGRMKESLEKAKQSNWLPLGLLSDVSWILKDEATSEASLDVLRRAISAL